MNNEIIYRPPQKGELSWAHLVVIQGTLFFITMCLVSLWIEVTHPGWFRHWVEIVLFFS